jgi:hypothetical protein
MPSAVSLLDLPEKACRWNLQGESGATLVLSLDPKEQSLGSSKMPNISAWPNDALVCSLSQVLERGLIPQQYYLSSTACAGILRRAEKRGKRLPEPLMRALQLAVSQGQTELAQTTSFPQDDPMFDLL